MIFIPKELADKLQKKGYPMPTNIVYATYKQDGKLCPMKIVGEAINVKPIAPTIEQVLEWMRRNHHLSIEPYSCACGWRVTICKTGNVLEGYVSGGTCVKDEVKGDNDGGAFNFYKQAAIAGIEYALNNLI